MLTLILPAALAHSTLYPHIHADDIPALALACALGWLLSSTLRAVSPARAKR